ncbi:DUF4304 domain-containing protein [Hymenobacter sp. BT683]|uniref:DUF4304 domain-containing protein n=1 Tax=Hymenobacter jeongseonensis TaxID=2791027 RepID=A0ABS0INM3_9BACT|nr:DUF4304 domain-containing protein [Hymenobacter jeongseonensis]MBF9239961.1 DUF4304 domain-containing protein [Hymenobacter jeongseonensis]
MTKELWPAFKARGYRKTGNNFRYYNPLGWGKIINLQKSVFGDRHAISFTVNTGLYLAEADRYWTGQVAADRFLEPDCLVRARVGKLSGSSHDVWYELTEQTVPTVLYQQVRQDVETYVLPYLDRMISLDDVVQHLLVNRQPASAQAISTVFACGYHEQALQWLADELATTTSCTHRLQMESLKASLA